MDSVAHYPCRSPGSRLSTEKVQIMARIEFSSISARADNNAPQDNGGIGIGWPYDGDVEHDPAVG